MCVRSKIINDYEDPTVTMKCRGTIKVHGPVL
jgi:hypothetical protein